MKKFMELFIKRSLEAETNQLRDKYQILSEVKQCLLDSYCEDVINCVETGKDYTRKLEKATELYNKGYATKSTTMFDIMHGVLLKEYHKEPIEYISDSYND